MNASKTIRARVELPCSVRLSGSDCRIVRGTTELITRDSLILAAPSVTAEDWLKSGQTLMVAIELPITEGFEPRDLHCTVIAHRIGISSGRVRIVSEVRQMAFVVRDLSLHARSRDTERLPPAQALFAIPRSQVDQPVIPRNHPNSGNLNSTGEYTMSFLKKLLIEEDGQDMVEYGLVIALVVMGAVVALGTFNGKIGNALGTLGNAIAGVTNF